MSTTEVTGAFPFVEMGNKKGKVLVFLAGFPDNCTSGWSPVLDLLVEKNEYRMICLCLPGYLKDAVMPTWGYDFPVLIKMMENTLNSLLAKDEKFTLCIHDWGCIIGTLYQNKYPKNIERMAMFDVGIVDVSPAIKDLAICSIYQTWLAMSFAISQLNNTLGEWFFRIIFVLFAFLPFLGPTPYDKAHRPGEEILVKHCYPYYYLLRGVLSGHPLRTKFPSCPILYMYGKKKNCMFHTKSFLDQIDSTPGCKWIEVNSGHWVMHAEPQMVTEEMIAFIKK
mmetsp:Transcript_23627/g.22757  ORF Transcript_23627/g.22757 Transcript_23627/m.22757 type:complete len:280 (+) Transcript_23627:82-921(+)